LEPGSEPIARCRTDVATKLGEELDQEGHLTGSKKVVERKEGVKISG
jgi:hypothetical protein